MTDTNPAEKKEKPPSLPGRKVLVADDNPVIRRGLQIYLQKWGYTFIEATDGEAAYRLLAADHTIRLAIIDWHMPKLDGLTLCQRLRAQPPRERPYVYCIMFTGTCDSEKMRIQALVGGADIFLKKPCEPNFLRACLLVGKRLVEAMDSSSVPADPAVATVPAEKAPVFLKEIELEDDFFL
jgi:DNA-binding response OmpR family regulator